MDKIKEKTFTEGAENAKEEQEKREKLNPFIRLC